MKQRSRKEQFYYNLGEAMSMNNMRSFINLETLAVDIHGGNEEFEFDFEDEEEDTADEVQEALDNPGKFMPVEPLSTSESFQVMEAFAGTIQDRNLQRRLIQALEGRKPFASFRQVVDNSDARQEWFTFRDEQYAELAKEWIKHRGSDALKEKIKRLPSVFIA